MCPATSWGGSLNGRQANEPVTQRPAQLTHLEFVPGIYVCDLQICAIKYPMKELTKKLIFAACRRQNWTSRIQLKSSHTIIMTLSLKTIQPKVGFVSTLNLGEVLDNNSTIIHTSCSLQN